jgi:hypothetical protein
LKTAASIAALVAFAGIVLAVVVVNRSEEAVLRKAPVAEQPNASSVVAAAMAGSAHDVDPDERLRIWADGIAPANIPEELERIDKLNTSDERSAARRALLFSWTSRDLVAVTRWVGTLGPAHSLQQEGRELIVEALLQCDPEAVVAALRESLPETTSRELYGPYFRGWAAEDPEAAAVLLVRLANAEPRDPRQWNDLLGQVSAQWMTNAPETALRWFKALPDGAQKSAALLQASHRWAELDPGEAAAYAVGREDSALVKTVAAKWAETTPDKALAWARGLPEGTLRTEAVASAIAIMAQGNP